MIGAKDAGATRVASADENSRLGTVRPGRRYFRKDGGCFADPLAVRDDRVLVMARWHSGKRFEANCLWLQLDDFCRRYAAEPMAVAA